MDVFDHDNEQLSSMKKVNLTHLFYSRNNSYKYLEKCLTEKIIILEICLNKKKLTTDNCIVDKQFFTLCRPKK
jgi:hypothetical protein